MTALDFVIDHLCRMAFRIRLSRTLAMALVVGLLAATPCLAANWPVYLHINECPGSATLPGGGEVGLFGFIAVYAETDGLAQLFNQKSGLPSGVAEHSVVKITKQIDKATPCLRQMAATGGMLREADILFVGPSLSGTGLLETYYIVKLRQAYVVDVHTNMRLNLLPENASLPALEEVSFTFESIEWRWLPDNIVESDKWKR